MPFGPALPNGVRAPSTKATERCARSRGLAGAATVCSLAGKPRPVLLLTGNLLYLVSLGRRRLGGERHSEPVGDQVDLPRPRAEFGQAGADGRTVERRRFPGDAPDHVGRKQVLREHAVLL